MTAPLFSGIGMGGHHSHRSQTDEWLTPPAIITALGGAGSFDLDPCAPARRPWPTARRHLTRSDDGLSQAWRGRVWLNPPYSTALLARFMGRMAAHGRGTALIFARTETEAWFASIWDHAAALLFIRGRLNFHHLDGRRAAANSGAPSVLIAYGAADAEILAFAGIAGAFCPLRLPRVVAIAALEQTWREAVADQLRPSGTVTLAELYRALARHPKAGRNPNWRAKIRQVLQQGPFERVDRGTWRLAS